MIYFISAFFMYTNRFLMLPGLFGAAPAMPQGLFA